MGVEIVFSEDFAQVMQKIDSTSKARMTEAINTVRNKTLETLSGSRTGRTYFVPGTQKTYTASAPGEPPAVATARLKQSIKGGLEGQGKNVLGFVGTEIDYGRMLEFGTSKIAPRPWLRVSFEKSEQAVKSIFTRLWF